MSRVLLAEDDEALRDGLSRALRYAGHDVRAVADGDAAAQLLEADGGTIDLLVLDFGLPKTPGVDVLRRARAQRSTLPVLLVSAYTDAFGQVEAAGLNVEAFLAKPFGVDEFDAKVRQLVGVAA